MFNIGDRVKSLGSVGQVFIGEIVGLSRPFLTMPANQFCWDKNEKLQGWREGLVAVIKLNEHIVPITLEEMLVQGGTREAWENYPKVNLVSHPTVDLLVIQEACSVAEDESHV